MWKKRAITWTKELAIMVLLFFIATITINYLKAPEISSNILHDFEATTTKGKTISRRNLLGHPTLIHFWGTWCPVCKTEIDNIRRIARNYPVVAIAVKSPDLDKFTKEHALNFDIIDDSRGDIAAKFGITTFPTSIFLDAAGEPLFVETGYTTTAGLWLRLWFLSRFR